ncbi:MAG: Spi family protease inhibitor [Duncaniella sp.]|nr:Spi family protease inhibitor [Duncaniella sp.]
MKLKFTLFGMLVALLTGCSSDDDVLLLNVNLPVGEVCESATSQNVKAIAKYIGRHHHTVSRSTETLLSPYVVDGDTVMYIANYGEGWEVFSNDPRVPMVLMKSDSGNFYPTALDNESPFDALFQNTAHYLSSVKNKDFAPTDTINSEWMAYGIKTLGVDDPEKDPDSNNGGYHWKYVGGIQKNYHDIYVPTGGRLKTRWYQEGTFKLYTPLIGNEHVKLGCTAVAIGQYLYFTHYKDNRPEKTVTTAVYDNKNSSYVFSGASSTVWDLFTDTEAYMPYAEPTAIFLGWVAQKINTDFSQSSGADTEGATLSFFNSQTQLKASVKPYERYLVENIMEKGYPVIIRANKTTGSGGHMWIIDYYDSQGYINCDYYIYINSSGESTGEDEDLDGDFFDNLTVEKIKEVYGDVEVDTRVYTRNKSFIRCNWGLNGWYDNTDFDANILSWAANGSVYDKDHMIYYFE